MDINGAMVKRLSDHREVGRRHTACYQSEGWAWILVEARKIDGLRNSIGIWIDDRESV